MYKDKTIAVVCPAYNEERLIADTLCSIPDVVDRVYVVDDGSTDRTPEIIQSLDRNVTYFRHPKNQGVGAAIVTGYKRFLEEGLDIAVVMAGDNQMDPCHLPRLLAPIIEGRADYTKGDRLSKPENKIGISRWRRFGNRLLTWLTRIASGNWKLSDPQNGYTAVTNAALNKLGINSIHHRYGYCNDILVKLTVIGLRIIDVPMPARYGNEISKIRYSQYIPSVSWLLLRDFIWRLFNRIRR